MCPITSSAKKALRQSQSRRKRNVRQKDEIKSLLKQTENFVLQNKKGEAKKLLPRLYKLLDKAVKTGLMKKNAAARKKSRFARLAN
jgi:small subunit ribosomal protein S20